MRFSSVVGGLKVKVLGVLLYLSLQSAAQSTVYGVPTDKVLHFTIGHIITTGSSAAFHQLGVENAHWYGLGVGIAAGIVKEMIDAKADPNDAYATFAGAITGAVVIYIPIRDDRRKKKKTLSY